jgi:indole-3-glycerol phosphate synthase
VPLLAKDFYVDPWQVIEARTHGADAILVILAMVEDGLALELQQQAEDLDMDVLCEVHSEDELRRALTLGFPVVGANARNLDTLEVNRAQGHDLLRAIPRGYVRVAESGIASKEDALAAKAAGANAALVGTALMRDPGLIQELVGL